METAGKVVLITGASSGMGKATARLLIQKGYKVYAVARRTEKMNDLENLGAIILQTDVSDDRSLQNCIHTVISNEAHIDVLINNAGFGLLGAIEDIPISDARYQMEVNVFGLARLVQLVLPYMRRQRSGKIVNISSTSGKIATPLSGWYAASKFAVEALSDSLRMEVNQFGIEVIIIEPGGIKSEWSAIAKKNLQGLSSGKAYSQMADKILEFSKKALPKNRKPEVIAELLFKAISARHPKTRYHAGYMAGTLLFLKKILTDKKLDKLILGQMK